MITINVVTMNRVVLIMMVLIIMMMIRTILYMTILSVEPFLRTTTFLVMLVLSVSVMLLYRVAMVCVMACMGSVVCLGGGVAPFWPEAEEWDGYLDEVALLRTESDEPIVCALELVRMAPVMRTARPGAGSMCNSIVCSTVLRVHHHRGPAGPAVRTVTFGRRPFPYAGPVWIR